MQPRIVNLTEMKLVGKHLTISLVDYKVGELWQSFMPVKRNISTPVSNNLISMSVYKPGYFTNFDTSRNFEKWAALEVQNFEKVPDGMSTFVLPGGLYAVFAYRGLNTDHSIYDYIFKTWLPSSDYTLDDRPHFEVLGSKYKNNDPLSEEDIYIPVKIKI